ncbi:thioredoxin family protein [Cytobacillus solani]|uniref:thioredoxin family protein n=1 Tax=Cytobacillus solani TaxID=1637975 RepID=UPI0006ABCD63|nr:thioredoxin family protein [Cytobacillus solani]KOP80003.1 thioredoxin [Bacillus sp. FJAT-21945]USK54412.1 thioredoxin family protein [Cytobacillus solani]
MQEWSRKMISEALAGDQVSLIYLYTPLCGTCQVAGKMMTVIKELLPNLPIGKTDLNYMPDVAEKWEIESVPCLLIFKNGMLEEKVYAFQSVPYLLNKIKSLI